MSRTLTKIRRPSNKNVMKLARQIEMVVFDFDGVFTDNRVLVMQDGSEAVFCSRADGLGLERLKKIGIQMLVLSKETNPVVQMRCKKLNISCIQGCDNKKGALKDIAAKSGVSLGSIAFVGNDINDLECLQIVGLPACVADSTQEVLDVSLFTTKALGGCGAVREFCDYIARANKG